MKPDLYTKVVLTVIAVMLTVIASHQLLTPATVVNAQGHSPILFSAATGNATFYFYNPDNAILNIVDPNGNRRIINLHQAY
jgi:hypothetical protein